MADLFTRLVTGPASVAPLAPRVPTLHEPTERSDVDENAEVASPARAPALPQPPSALSPSSSWEAPAVAPRLVVTQAPAPSLGMEVVRRMEAAAEPERAEQAPADAVTPSEPGDLGGLVLPQRHKSSKISPELRPRETQPLPPRHTRQPERTTVRIEIGRIEIRAPQPSVPPPAPQVWRQEPEAQQGLSLADYLRGNDGRPR